MNRRILAFHAAMTHVPGTGPRANWGFHWRAMSAGFLCMILTGCYDTTQEITLNPDGSGKAVIESTSAHLEPLLNGTETRGFEASRNAFLQKLIREADGVEAWRDISYRELDDGRITVRATAYFSDLSKFRTELNGFVRFTVERDQTGLLSIRPAADTSKSPFALPATNDVINAEAIRHERQKFRACQPLMIATFGTMKQDTVIRIPGVVRRVSNFETNAPGSLRLRFDGAHFLAALERGLFDPDITKQRMSSGTSENVLLWNEVLYGKRGPALAVIKPGNKSLFNFTNEVAEARQAFPLFARTLGLDDGVLASPKSAVDGTAAIVTVTGMEWRFIPEPSSPLFGKSKPGYTLSLRAALPKTVLETREIRVTRAITLEGVALDAPPITTYHSPSDIGMTGRTNLNFDVHLAPPPLNSRGFAEVSGFVDCGSAENRQAIELFNGRLLAGARNAEFATEIEFIGPDAVRGGKIVLCTDLPPDRLLSLKVSTDTGQTIELQRNGMMKVGAKHSYTYTTTRTIPRSGKIVASVLSGAQAIRIPFALTNLSLLGQPLALR